MMKVNVMYRWLLLVYFVLLSVGASAAKPKPYRYCYQGSSSSELVLQYAKALVFERKDSTEIYIVRPWVTNHRVEYIYFVVKCNANTQMGTFNTRNGILPVRVSQTSRHRRQIELNLKFDSEAFSDFTLYLSDTKLYD